MSKLMYALKRRKRRRPRASLRPVALLLAGIVLLWLGIVVYRYFTPIVIQLATVEANNMVSAVINNTIAAKLADGEMKYNDIITLEKDESGAVAAIITDVAKINLLKAEITTDVISALSDGIRADISIPLGNITGIKLLSGKGPDIPVEIVTAAQTDTEFLNRFSSAGINQTCHQIVVRVKAGVRVIIPGKSVYTETSAEVPVAETVIIGDVPDSYTYFEGDENWDENLERFDITT
ncbi:MAG: sporulation protein YunB [Clostridiales bacterium]|nr:sporulation protein YunB [Clostridiales bacterium]